MQNKERWGSRIGVILAVMGSAIGWETSLDSRDWPRNMKGEPL